jgi:hypothetical protein
VVLSSIVLSSIVLSSIVLEVQRGSKVQPCWGRPG